MCVGGIEGTKGAFVQTGHIVDTAWRTREGAFTYPSAVAHRSVGPSALASSQQGQEKKANQKAVREVMARLALVINGATSILVQPIMNRVGQSS